MKDTFAIEALFKHKQKKDIAMNLPQYKHAKVALQELHDAERDPFERQRLARQIQRLSIKIEQKERQTGIISVH